LTLHIQSDAVSMSIFLMMDYNVDYYIVSQRFIEKINMTKSELQKHCIDSGVALVRLHLDN